MFVVPVVQKHVESSWLAKRCSACISNTLQQPGLAALDTEHRGSTRCAGPAPSAPSAPDILRAPLNAGPAPERAR